MKKNLFSLLIFCACCRLGAQNRYLEPVFDQVKVTHDLVYAKNATVETIPLTGQAIPVDLLFDFYEPEGDTATTRPVVIVVHRGDYLYYLQGSCLPWYQDSLPIELCTRLARMGYAVAAIDIRTGWSPLDPLYAKRVATWINAYYRSIQDLRTAVRFFKKTAAEDANPFRIDTAKIVVWGENTGGMTVLGASYANSFPDWVNPAMMIAPGGMPAVLESVNGNIEGSSYGVVPPNYWLFPAGDTLCYPNWPGYSSHFQMAVSLAGAIPNLPWVDPGEPPALLFHAFSDAYIPCNTGLWVPQYAPFAFELTGSCTLAPILESSGCNQVFEGLGLSDPISQQASLYNNGHDGFYPFTGLSPESAEPWYWGTPCMAIQNVNTDGATARLYLDTVIAYFAPRACAVLNLNCSGSSTIGGPSAAPRFFISPNPATETITMNLAEGANPGPYSIRILNAQGEQVLQAARYYPGKEIDIKNWPSGYYVIIFTDDIHTMGGKFVKH